jgi:RNA 2',3'-cyclic 3'-phosphodiesterase
MRAFLAVAIPIGLREQTSAVQQQLKNVLLVSERRIRVAWVKPETVHLTLKFLGDIDEAAAELLRTSVSAVTDGWPVIEIPIEIVGAFPRPQAPRTLWIGPPREWESQDEARRAVALAARIDEACAQFGVPRDSHPWRPHLTIARVREGERDAGRALEASGLMARQHNFGSLRIAAITLMKSDTRPDGPVHTPLWTVALAR